MFHFVFPTKKTPTHWIPDFEAQFKLFLQYVNKIPTTSSSGIFVGSPNGTTWKIAVDDTDITNPILRLVPP